MVAQVSRKEVGCCSLCDEPVFEVLERFPEGHPLGGRIRRISQVLTDPDAKRVSLLQLSSLECGVDSKRLERWAKAAQHEITLCSKCSIDHTNIVGLWKKCMEAYAECVTVEHQLALGKPPNTQEQQDYSEQVACWMVNTPPIGVMHEQKWSEVIG